MKETVLRLIVVIGLGVTALIVAHADAQRVAIPGSVVLVGMSCIEASSCAEETQVNGCLYKTQGASCTFCSGGGSMKVCRSDPNDQCRIVETLGACGNRISGNCTPDGHGGLVCTGDIVSGTCALIQCAN